MRYLNACSLRHPTEGNSENVMFFSVPCFTPTHHASERQTNIQQFKVCQQSDMIWHLLKVLMPRHAALQVPFSCSFCGFKLPQSKTRCKHILRQDASWEGSKQEAKDVSLFFFLGFFWVGAVLEGGATAAQGIQLAFNDNRRTHRYILRIWACQLTESTHTKEKILIAIPCMLFCKCSVSHIFFSCKDNNPEAEASTR